MSIIEDRVRRRASSRPHDRAVSDRAGRWSNVELHRYVDAVAGGLLSVGVGDGSRVAALVEDAAPTVALMHAAWRLGAILVPLNRRAALPELLHQLDETRVDVLVHDAAHAERAEALTQTALPGLRMTDLLAARPSSEPMSPIDGSQPAAILFTSGTSGRPKGAVLTHANLVASADAWAARLEPRPTDRWLACLPLYHVAGLAIVVRADCWDVPVEVHGGFDVAAVEAAIDAGVTHVSLVPETLDRLLVQRAGRQAPASLRAVLVGGGPIPSTLIGRAHAVGVTLVTTYGMTETASGIAAGAEGTHPRDGLPRLYAFAGVDISIAGSPGTERTGGEIVVSGPMVSPGYVERGRLPSSLAEADASHAFHTGDVGWLDDDEGLILMDRRDDLIVSGGENIYPAEIESILCEHPDVADAAVIGRADAAWGAVPIAAIVTVPGQDLDAVALARHCHERLGTYKVPAEFHAVKRMPRGPEGKLSRREVRTLIRDEDG